MATQQDIDFTYSTMDRIFRQSMGETADFSGAMYNGNFKLSLEEAQAAKHGYMAEQLHIGKGSRVLDMGCGWGPFLAYITKRGAIATGLTFSEGQYKACRKNGFDVHIKDARSIQPGDLGTFDAIVSVGAFEHFCSYADYKEGKQEKIYQDFFERVYNLLPPGGRFYLQTMAWGKNMIPVEDLDKNPAPGSDAFLIKLMTDHFPGSWLPYGKEMIFEAAAPFFTIVEYSSGRLDYIETTKQWRKRIRQFSLEKYALYLKLIPKFIRNKEFRYKLQVFRHKANQKCFERELMDHYRIVLEKKKAI
jgi:cyclopropane-fatty-acyl-phospholipid synthase